MNVQIYQFQYFIIFLFFCFCFLRWVPNTAWQSGIGPALEHLSLRDAQVTIRRLIRSVTRVSEEELELHSVLDMRKVLMLILWVFDAQLFTHRIHHADEQGAFQPDGDDVGLGHGSATLQKPVDHLFELQLATQVLKTGMKHAFCGHLVAKKHPFTAKKWASRAI